MLRLPTCLLAACLLVVPTAAFAQLDAVDPDAKPKARAAEEATPYDDPVETPDTPVKKTNLNQVDPDATPRVKPDAPTGEKPIVPTNGGLKKKGKAPEPVPEPPKPKAPGLIITRASDADLETAWETWRKADASKDTNAEAKARGALKALMGEVGATAFEPYAVGFIRASRAHEKAGDATGAIELALSAVELAPELPSAHFGLALAYFDADPSEIGRWVAAFKVAAGKFVMDPRFVRPMAADFGSGLLYALVWTAIAVTAVLFLRRARYFLYDFHWFFPRVLARWHTVALGVLLLSVPIIFRMGLVPVLLVFFAAGALYMSLAERVVIAVAIALLGLVPLAASALVDATAFAGTRAERVWDVETGGPGVEPRAQELAKLAAENQASFAELEALGSFELKRGKLDLALGHLRSALEKSNNEQHATNNLAVAMLLAGDLENPRTLLPIAAKADPAFAPPLYNQWRLAQRRVAAKGDSAAGEVDEGNRALSDAKQRDASLATRFDPPADKLNANQVMIIVPTPRAAVLELAKLPGAADRVESQLTQTLLGDVPESLAPFYPGLLALLLVGFGFLAVSVEAARPCNKCGRPVSQREDRELSKASQMCTQCINVFARKGVVPPSLKVRKQIEVARYQQNLGRASYFFGFCSGMGHVFGGWPVRGAIYGFLFFFTVRMLWQRDGMLRVIYEGPPTLLKVLPMAIACGLIYVLTFIGLTRRQA